MNRRRRSLAFVPTGPSPFRPTTGWGPNQTTYITPKQKPKTSPKTKTPRPRRPRPTFADRDRDNWKEPRTKTGTKTKVPEPVNVGPTTALPKYVPLEESNTVSLRFMGGQERKQYKTNIVLGRKNSKTLRDLIRENGTATKVLFDTMQNSPSRNLEGTSEFDVPRTFYSHSFGFNSKNYYFLPGNSHITLDDIDKLYDTDQPSADTVASNRDIDTYASVVELRQNLSIYNQSTFFPMKCKVHLCSHFHEPNVPIATNLLAEVFPQNINLGTSQNVGQIPKYWLHSEPTKEFVGTSPFSTQFSVDMSLKASLRKSEWFKDNIHVVKTFTKRLPSFATWDLSYKYTLKSGVHTQRLSRAMTEQTPYSPKSHFWIIETCGYRCEGIENSSDGAKRSYIGTNYGYYHVEFSKSLKYVASSIAGNQSSTTDSTVHLRSFRSTPSADQATIKREYFKLDGSFATNTSGSTKDDTLAIPLVTDDRVIFGSKTTGPAEDQPAD